MEPCPNCGAPTRSGAKFCTTCGYRLTGGTDSVAAAPAPDDPDAPPAASLDAVAARPDATSDEPAASPFDPAEPEPTTDDDPAAEAARGVSEGAFGDVPASAPADQVISSAWPAAPASSWPGGWGSLTGPATSPEEPPSESGPSVAWPNVQSGDVLDDDAVQPSGDLPLDADAAELADTVPAADVDGVAEQAEGAGDDPGFAPASGEAAFPSAPVEDRVAPPLPDPVGTGAEEEDADPVGRAVALVEELRALLPALSAAPAVDLAAVAADLDATLAAAPPSDDLDALRAAAVAARDRPRDLDALIDLAARADPVLAVLDAHDRLAAAAGRVVATLRAGTG